MLANVTPDAMTVPFVIRVVVPILALILSTRQSTTHRPDTCKHRYDRTFLAMESALSTLSSLLRQVSSCSSDERACTGKWELGVNPTSESPDRPVL